MNKNLNARRRPETGLTMVELMITMLLAAVMVTGLFSLMSSQNRGYEQQSSVLGVQENLLGAMEYLQSQIRVAGYGFGRCPNYAIEDNNTVTPTWIRWLEALRVFNGCNLTIDNPATATCNDLNVDKADSFSVGYVEPSIKRVLGATGQLQPLVNGRLKNDFLSTDTEMVLDTAAMFQKDDLLLLWEAMAPNRPCVAHKVVSNVPEPPNSRITLPKFYSAMGPAILSTARTAHQVGAASFAAGTIVINLGPNPRMRHVSIQTVGTAPSRLVTWRTNNPWPAKDMADLEIIADGVEDLQVAYACDADGDGDLEEGIDTPTRLAAADDWSFNAPKTSAPSDRKDCQGRPIQSVRITLVGRTPIEDPAFNNKGFRPAAEDRDKGVPDNYRRRVLTSTMSPRNILTNATP